MSFALFWRVHQKSVANFPFKLALCVPKITLRLITVGVHYTQIKNMNGVTDIDSLRAKVRDQGDIVRRLKEEKAPDNALKEAISALKAYKKALDDKEIELSPKDPAFDRGKLEDLLKQKFFYDQSFSIYGGIQGLYDYGPMGCAMKANLLSAWRQFFILEDHLLEVDCSMLTPEPVLQASGHVDRFTDLMVKDVKTGDCFRADHLVKSSLEAKKSNKKTPENEKQEIDKIIVQLDNYGADELHQIIRRFDIKSPTTMNDLTEPKEFNLMFSTMIGPTGQCKGYLRPETAQGIFVNFQRLLQFNQGRLPFGAAQIGSAFRNEISPRSGLIRVREFTMAEIEYFVDPSDKRHPKFEDVRNTEMLLYSSCDQMSGERPRNVTIGEAVDRGVVANQTLGYFMARIHLFLIHIGVDAKRLRFRQHLSNEMAHYACDCWDAECQTSYGWIECVGCADRSCYDLNQHSKATGTRLVAEKPLDEPKTVQVCECIPNKGELGKVFRGEAKTIIQQLSSLTLDECHCLNNQLKNTGKATLTVNGKQVDLNDSMVQIKEYKNVVHVTEIVPNVIEPSFGIGRILYTIFEHSFRVREGDEQRTYLSISPVLAPYKCSLLPLSNHADFVPVVRKLSSELTKYSVSHRVDESSGSIGRRYARTDQIAIPYGITIDFDTLNKLPPSATLRERDSMKQIRVPLDELPSLMSDIASGNKSWDDARAKYPAFEQQETAQKNETAQSSSNEHSLDSITKHIGLGEISNSVKEQKNNITKTHQYTTPVHGEQTDESKETHASRFGKKALNWTDCGKTIRKRYKEQEEREKSLTGQDILTHTSVSNNLSRNTETGGIISGYDADHEDNTYGFNKLSRIHPQDSSAQLSDLPQTANCPKPLSNVPSVKKSFDSDKSHTEHDFSSEYPPLSSNSKSREKLPYHGVFVGDGWPNGKKVDPEPKTNNSNFYVSKHNHAADKSQLSSNLAFHNTQRYKSESTSNKNSSEWVSTLAKLDQPQFEAEMSQFFDGHSTTVRTEHMTTSKCTSKSSQQPVVSQSNELSYHGLFVGEGWPSLKPNKKGEIIHSSGKSETRNIELEKIWQSEKDKPNKEIAGKTNECDWSSVFSQIAESHLDSEQNQLNQIDLTDFNAFGTPKKISDTQLPPVLQDFEPDLHAELSQNDQEKIKTIGTLEQRTNSGSGTLIKPSNKTEDRYNTNLIVEPVSKEKILNKSIIQSDVGNDSELFVSSSPTILNHMKSDTKQTKSEVKAIDLCVHKAGESNEPVINEVSQNKPTPESQSSASLVNPEVLYDKNESPIVSNNPKQTDITSSKDKAKKHRNRHKKKKKTA
ncbi:putative glycyl-tRNA synthetase [Schistosoma mansoni]|nr:putative glycyl-tRNA synthetase [Schistosoma mansoni]|eukprot:XP_018651366.1 putative glycyl-tRNA synthetase [Schistosoma mansoni]